MLQRDMAVVLGAAPVLADVRIVARYVRPEDRCPA